MPPIVISFAESAIRDLGEMRDGYSEQGVPDIWARMTKELFPQVQALSGRPDRGQVVPEFDQSFLRELIKPPFRLVYRLDLQRMQIVRAQRSERQLCPSVAGQKERLNK